MTIYNNQFNYPLENRLEEWHQYSTKDPITNAIIVPSILTEIVLSRGCTSKVIDIGCGNGWVAERLIKESPIKLEYTCLDRNERILQYAKMKLLELRKKGSKIHFLHHNIEKSLSNIKVKESLPRLYDMALMVFTIMELDFSYKIVKNIVTLLQPGGILLIYFPNYILDLTYGCNDLKLVQGRLNKLFKGTVNIEKESRILEAKVPYILNCYSKIVCNLTRNGLAVDKLHPIKYKGKNGKIGNVFILRAKKCLAPCSVFDNNHTKQ